MLEMKTAESISALNQIPATVRSLYAEGPLYRVELDAGFPLFAVVTHPSRERLQLEPGRQVFAVIKAPAVHVLPR
jgi:molybdate transport system ATP-binding protein